MHGLEFVSNVVIANTLIIPSDPMKMIEAISKPKIESAIEITLSIKPDNALALLTGLKLIIQHLDEIEDIKIKTSVGRLATELLGAVDTAINQR